MLAAIVNFAVDAVPIEKYVTAVPSLSFCDCIVYVTAPCPFVAAVNVLFCADVLNVVLHVCAAVTLIGFAALLTVTFTVISFDHEL